jgi:hypothetical protein
MSDAGGLQSLSAYIFERRCSTLAKKVDVAKHRAIIEAFQRRRG